MLNQITVMGRLTRDPELKTTTSGTSVTSFTLAVDRDFTGKDGGDRKADFIDCIAWRSTAEFVNKYFTKGSMAVISGRLQTRDWTDRDGNKRKATEIVAANVYFGEKKTGGSSSGSSGSSGGSDSKADDYAMSAPDTAAAVSFDIEDDGELPF